LFVLYLRFCTFKFEVSRTPPFRSPFEGKIERSFVAMIFMPISALTFDLAVCNNAKAIEACDLWDIFVDLFPQNMEKIFF
jgi:hypothetical protein